MRSCAGRGEPWPWTSAPSSCWSGGRDYTVDLDVALKFDDVPPWLRSALFFWNWNAVPVTRYRMEFQY